MKTILETDRDFICDIKAPCFQMLLPEEAEIVRSSKTGLLVSIAAEGTPEEIYERSVAALNARAVAGR